MTTHPQPPHGQFKPKYESIDFVDVARKISKLCCHGGKTRRFYSEAERSVRLASLMPQYKIYGLLHAVPKAFSSGGSNASNYAVEAQVCAQLGILPLNRHPAKPLMGWADDLLLVTEHRDVIVGLSERWRAKHEHIVPTYWQIEPWSAEQAEWRWVYELEIALRLGDIPIPSSVDKYLNNENAPYAPDYARPVSRGEIRGFGLRDHADFGLLNHTNDYLEMQIGHHAYTLFNQPIDLSPYWG